MSVSRPVSRALPSPDRASVATSVVIVAYHRPDALARLLAALDAPDVDIVVVNVEADTAVRDAVAVHPGASVIDQENLGYAAAVNRGVTKATSDVVVFTNDDVILGSATVRALAERIRAGAADVVVPAVHDEHGRVSPTIAALPTPRNLLWQWALLPDTPIPGWPSRLRPEKWRRPGTAERVEAASAATVAVATELLAAVPLPEQYFLYWEESDWFVQLARCDASVVYDPEHCVVHSGGRDDIRPDKARLMATNAVRCVRDTQGTAAARRAWWIVLLWQARLLAVDSCRRWRHDSPATRARLDARRAGLIAARRARSLVR